MSLCARVKVFLEMIKFEHTIFALPFAFTGAILAARGLPTFYQTFWIVMAMIGARTAAMGTQPAHRRGDRCEKSADHGRAIPAGLIDRGHRPFVSSCLPPCSWSTPRTA